MEVYTSTAFMLVDFKSPLVVYEAELQKNDVIIQIIIDFSTLQVFDSQTFGDSNKLYQPFSMFISL